MTSHNDDLSEARGQPARPVALYQGPRVTLFRGWALILLIVACVATGAGLTVLWPRVVGLISPPAPPVAAQSVRARIGRATLSGPIATEPFPPDEITLINVWREGCADCMPAFKAWAELRRGGALADLPIVNVAYGSAGDEFSARYDVATRLVFDAGEAFVVPLQITTFTSLLVDRSGHVLLRDSPAQEGFAERVSAAAEVARHFDAVEMARKLSGSWRGSYTCRQGLTALTLDVELVGCDLMATFNFAPHPDNPGVPSGSFRMAGEYDPKGRVLSFSAQEADWIDRPQNYMTVDLRGDIDDDLTSFAGNVTTRGCTSFRLER